MTGLVLGLDQGTSSTRCLALDRGLNERGSAQIAVGSAFPRPGWVEQDPEELVRSAVEAIAGALREARAPPSDVLALGIANQTETFVLWDRASGRPIHPAIVWQDRRTDADCQALRAEGHEGWVRERTGLQLEATFPASKLRWLLEHVPGARQAAQDGRLAYGDVAAWLVHRLAGVHLTDAGNAGRSLLCRLGGLEWDEELLQLFEVPPELMPPIVDSDAPQAPARIPGLPGELPIRALAGDQQASLFGLRCWKPGSATVTLGTGAFVLAQAGISAPSPPHGVLASCAWRRAHTTSFALEGFVPTAGAATDWFGRVGALPGGAELAALLREGADEDQDVVCVPALQGLGTPLWASSARGAVFGLSLATTRAELARAVLDGILHQVVDAIEAIGDAAPVQSVRLDGGLARSDWVPQRLADLAGVRIERTSRPNGTAIGAAALAGLAAGVWDGLEALPPALPTLIAEPELAPASRALMRQRWTAARDLARRWPERAPRD